MKNLAYLLLIGMLFTLTTATAQKEETLFGKRGIKLTGAWVSPGLSLSSFDGGDNTLLFRAKSTVLEFNKSVLVGWGRYSLDGTTRIDGVEGNVDMKYNGVVLGYTPKAEKVIHPTFMMMMGSGKSYNNGSDNIFVVQPSAGFDINIFRWMKVGASAGYRWVNGVDTPNLSSNQLSAPYAELRLKFGYSWGRNKNKRS